jgi:cytoskeleton protein RodZ
MTDQQPPSPPAPDNRTLGEQLHQARVASGIELSEIARLTHVRRDYLLALEAGQYEDLPEPVYTRNFVRLFAQAIGLPATAALAAYDRERNRTDAGNTPGAAAPASQARTASAPASAPARNAPREPRRTPPGSGPTIGGLIPTLLLVFVVVGLAVWGFNSTLFRPGSPSPAASTPAPAPAAESTPPAVPEAGGTVRLSIASEPPGARVFVDEFPLDGVTPITNAPVTGRDSRMVRLELEGYEPAEARIDLSFDRNLTFALNEVSEEVPDADSAAATDVADAAAGPPAGGAGQISLTVTEPSWLEIYPGAQRSGTPLVYTTAQPGQTYSFDLPVFVHVGNAAGVQAVVDGEDIGRLGSAGQVLGRVFTR